MLKQPRTGGGIRRYSERTTPALPLQFFQPACSAGANRGSPRRSGQVCEGREHLRLLPLIRDFERINVCSLRFEDAQKLAARIKIARATRVVSRVVVFPN
jgi:hypothetical protein